MLVHEHLKQVVEASKLPQRIASADEPTSRGPEWIAQQWDAARLLAKDSRRGGVLVLDEIQKIPGASDVGAGWRRGAGEAFEPWPQEHMAAGADLLGCALIADSPLRS